MKILEVKSYQPVMFQKRNETFFSRRDQMADLELSLLEGQSAVLVKSGTDCVIIPFTNIAFIRPEKVETKDVKPKGK